MTAILHLSVPVRDLDEACRFYVDLLGCRAGRTRPSWADVWFWGLQLTLQERPDETTAAADQGCRHFGVSLGPAEFAGAIERLRQAGDTVQWLTPLETAADPLLSGKTNVKVSDPSGNVIELKCYESPTDLVGDG